MLQKILSRMRKAIEDYRMIENGDHIAVGVSGGKDSIALLMGLKELQRFLPVQFELTAITLSLGFEDFDRAALTAIFERIGVKWHIEETNIGQTVFETRKETSPCSLCANLKRGTIHSTAKKLGCNKVAFGHHMDDAIETMMMALIYEGRIHCFSPVTELDRSGITLIRPLVYTEEKMIRTLMRKENIVPVKSGCPMDGITKRKTMKDHIHALKTENPNIKASLFGAIQRGHVNGWKPMGHSSQYKKGHPEPEPFASSTPGSPHIDGIPELKPMPGAYPLTPTGDPRPRNPFPHAGIGTQDSAAAGRDNLYRTMIDLLPTAVAIARESDSRLLYANRHAGIVFAMSPEEAFGFLTDTSYCRPEDARHVREVLKSKGALRDFEVQLVNAKGQTFWTMLSADLIRYGEETARIFSLSRIDALKEMEDKLKRSHARQTLILGMLLQLYHPTDLGQSYINVLGLAGRYLDIDRASLFSYQHDGSLRLRQEWRTQRRPAPSDQSPHLADRRNKNLLRLGQWMKTRSRFYTGIDDLAENNREGDLPEIPHPWVAQTLRIGEQPTALLLFEDFRSGHAWSEDDMMTLDAVSFIMTMAHERRQTEIALHAATRKAQEASLTKSRFLANMSHELRTPMNAILGYMDLLETTPLSGEQTDFVQEAKNASDILLYLINDVLDYSKIEAGHLSLESIRFDLRTSVENAVILHAPRAQEKGIEIGVLLDPGLPETVVGDPVRLEQVLANLIGNAVKFTTKGDVLVEVLSNQDNSRLDAAVRPAHSGFSSLAADLFPYLAEDEIPGQLRLPDPESGENPSIESGSGEISVIVRITDSGIGMSRPTIARLYSPFTQADTSTTRQFGGTGLGLAITHRLVEMMHGSISVESKEGAGSSFSVRLHFQLPGESSEVVEKKTSAAEKNDCKRLLLVEGSHMQGVILERYLSASGYDCTLASSAVDALTLLSEQPRFDALLLSTTLTDYPAPAMVNIFRSMPKGVNLPILLLTALSRRNSPAGKLGDLIQGTISRPYRMKDLVARLKPLHAKDHSSPDWEWHVPQNARSVRVRVEPEGAGSRDKPVVLLVEDNPTNRIVFENMLRVYGLTCDVASDGQEAVDVCTGKLYDIIFMDCQMPVLDGFEATRTIRGTPSGKHPHIVALTAHTLSGDRDRCLAAGMDDHIGKPVTMAALFERLDKMIAAMGFPTPSRETTVRKPDPVPPQEMPRAADMPEWAKKPPFSDAMKKIQRIPGISPDEAFELIQLFLTELSETVSTAREMTADMLSQRTHRHRGAAGSLHLDGFLHTLTLLETATKEGDRAMTGTALDDLEKMLADVYSD